MNWPLSGVLAAIAIVVGIVLLVLYAFRSGLVHQGLPDTVETDAVPTTGPSSDGEPAQQPRTLGLLGAGILVLGLVLGIVTAVGGWGGAPAGSNGSGACAQLWNGCPQATAPATAAPSLPSVVP